jgi:hypothetical protein
MLEGRPSDLPPKPTFIEGWQLGQPDVVLKAEKPYLLSATGSDQYWNFILPVPIHETRWVRAVEIRPGDRRLVHHANILVDRYESARRMEKDKGSGFGGMEVRIDSEVFDPDSHFLFWKPGTVVTNEPDGMAVDLLGIYPHAHYLGKDMLATALLPDGTTKALIDIKRWDLNWQAVYRYAEPVFLPKEHGAEDALCVRQLGGQHSQSQSSAGACARGKPIDRRNGAFVAAGASKKRSRSTGRSANDFAGGLGTPRS